MAIKITNLDSVKGSGVSNPEALRQNWYSGDSPTTRDVLGRISEIYDHNKLAGTFYSNQFFKLQQDASSPFYDPYAGVTNKAVSELASYGVDTSVIDDKFFRDNDYLRNYLRYDGNTNTPSTPGKKASTAEKAAYAYYQIWKSEDKTKKAEEQWGALKDELTYWTKRTDRNYSDDEIINKIDWSKYGELTSMDTNKLMQPNEYNRSIGYSKDAMYGVIWAARNDGGTGDIFSDMAMSARGKGNVWQDNQRIDNLLNPESPDFLPYAAGSTNLDEAAYHFGVQSFDKDWLAQNDGIQWNGTEEDKKFYNQVMTAEEKTTAAETALEGLDKWIKKFSWMSPEDAKNEFDKILSRGSVTVDGVTYDLSILNDMDTSIGKNGKGGTGNLIPMTRGVNYKYDLKLQELMQQCEKNESVPDGTEILTDRETGNPNRFRTPEEAPEQAAGQGINHRHLITHPELIEAGAAQEPGQEAKQNPALADRQDEYLARFGYTPEQKQDAILGNITDADIIRNKQEQRIVMGALNIIGNTATDDVKTSMGKTAGSLWDDIYNGFNAVGNWVKDEAQKAAPLVSKWADENMSTTNDATFQTSLKKIRFIDNYNSVSKGYGQATEEMAKLEAEYGSVDNYLKAADLENTKKIVEVGDGFLAVLGYDPETNRYVLKQLTDQYGTNYGDIAADVQKGPYKTGEEETPRDRLVWDVYNAVEEENKKDKDIFTARQWYDYNVDDCREAVDYMRQLFVNMEKQKQYLDENKTQYNLDDKEMKKVYEDLDLVWTVCEWLGKDTSGLQAGTEMLNFISGYIDQPHLKAESQTHLQKYSEMAGIYGYADTQENRGKYVHSYIGAIDNEIAKLQSAIEYMEAHAPTEGDDISVSFKLDTFANFDVGRGNDWYRDIEQNMRYKIEDLEYEKKQLEYEALLTDVPEADFAEAVEAGKAFERKVIDQTNGASIGLSGDDIYIEEAHSTYFKNKNFATEEEEQLYYYLIGEQAMALEKEYNELSNDPNRQIDAEKIERQILQAGSDYIQHMADDDRGVWTSRNNELLEKIGKRAVENGADTGILANAVATGMTIFQGPQALAQMLRSKIWDERMSANGSGRFVANFKKGVRDNTFKSIKEKYGEGSPQEKLASLFYEMYVNRGDSMVNQFTWGWLTGGADGMGAEMVSALPMGLTAAYDSMAEAIENGADMDQAWLIGGITLLFETGTEAITYGNIKEAFTTAKTLGVDGLKSFFKDWLLKSGIEEMIGETVTEVAEKWADDYAAKMKDNDFQSQHQQRVDYYRSKGKSPDEAEWLATYDGLKDLGHTALVSYLSPGSDVFIKTGKSAINSLNTYRRGTKADQKLGGSNSIWNNIISDQQSSGDAVEFYREPDEAQKKPSGEVITPETQNAQAAARRQRASGQEAGLATPEQKEAASDVVTLKKAGTSNQPTQTAALASVLTNKTGNKRDYRAEAAAAYLDDVFGQDGAEVVQQILEGAGKAGLNMKDVKNAIKNAALGDGAATALVQSEAFRNATNEEKAQMLAGTLEADTKNANVEKNTNAKILDYRRGRGLNNLALQGHFSEAQKAKQEADKAAEEDAQADTMLKEKQDALDQAKKDLETQDEQFRQNPTDDNLKQRQGAVTNVDNADESLHQYEQHKEKTEAAKQEADENAQKAADEATRTGLEIVDPQIEQEDQAQAEADAVAEQQRQEQEAEQARLQAEEDERTGKADEQRRYDAIETILDKEGLKEGEERDKRRKELRDKVERIKLIPRNLNRKLSNNTEGALTLYAFERKLGIPIRTMDLGPVNGNRITRGMYWTDENGNNPTIYLNENLIKAGKMTVGQALVEASVHEIVHSMKKTDSYRTYRNVVLESLYGKGNADSMELYNSNDLYRAAIDSMIAERQAAGDENFIGKSLKEMVEFADDEIVADFARMNLADRDVVERFMDNGLGGKIRNTLHNINQALKNYADAILGKSYKQWKAEAEQYNRETELWNSEHPDAQRELIDIQAQEDFYKNLEYLRKAEREYQKAMNEFAKAQVHPESNQFSVTQMAQSMNIGAVADNDTLALYVPDRNGTVIGDGKNGMKEGERYSLVDGVNVKITPEMIVNTPVGMLIDMGLDDTEFTGNDGLTHTQKGDARQMFADLMNLCARYRDNNLIWEIAGSEFSEAFSALKSNSDPQYKNTVDFGTICSKTQAIIDVLSQTMIDRVKAVREWNDAHRAEIEAGTEEERIFTGLTRDDIMQVYNITHNAGLSVPCPVCYVFSRWMGVPGMLGQMNRFQHQYVKLATDENGKTLYDENGDAVVDWDRTFETANGYLQGMVREYTKTKDNPNGIDLADPNLTPEERSAAIKAAKEKIDKQKNSIKSKIRSREKSLPNLRKLLGVLQEKLEQTDLTEKQREKIEEQIEKKEAAIKKNIRETDQFMDELKEFEAFNWVSQVVCLQHSEGRSVVNDLDENGNFVMDKENFRYTPEEILFDLNRSGEFAGYAKNWRYRTTRGAGMGKAIMPYSGASIGDLIKGDAVRWKQDQNPFLMMDEAAAKKAFENAKERVRKQNLVGGQRFQSTSDFRPEWGLDYIMSFLEMQALGSKVQMYTKVAEAVDFLGSIGADVNCSIMAKNNGFHEATSEEIELSKRDTDEGRNLRSRMGILTDENGNTKTYVMDFSDVTGMDYDTAKAKSKKFDSVQMILVGMNDIHIKLALGNNDIDFVIPWHSSGNSKDVLQQLVASVGEALEESSDYTDYQTDQIKSHKEGKGKKEKTIDDRSDLEIARWNARLKILTGIANKDFDIEKPGESGFGKIVVNGKEVTFNIDGKEITDERQLVYQDKWLRQLYDRFYVEGTDADCFGVAMTKDQAEQVFPYEYWDKTTTRENADDNGRNFVEYCDRLGLVPRFSQFKDVPGYWKLLIDRKMYENNILNEDGSVKEYGKYRDQKVVDVTKARIDNDPNEALDEKTDRMKKVYQLPESTTARYGQKHYSEETDRAIHASDEYLSEKYDGHMQKSMYGQLSEADSDLMSEDTIPYQAMVDAGAITQEELDAWRAENASRPLEGNNPAASTAQGTKVRAFAAEDGMLQDADELDNFAKAVVSAQNSYFPDTNEDQVIRALKWIKSLKRTENSNGLAEALEAVTSDNFDYRSADGQARMVAVMGLANAKNDIIAQTALADAFMRQGTDLGRALQARKLFKLMTPEGRISTLMKTLNTYNQDLKSKGMEGNLKFSDWIYQAAAYADNEADFRKVQEAAAAELASQLPISWQERLKSFRMLSMLANPRTHIRNLVGNALFVPAVGLKNKIGALMELGLEKGNRTKTLAPVLNSEIREFARQDARKIKDTLTGEAKYDENGLVQRAKNPLGPVLGAVNDFNSWALEGEDWMFLRGHYRKALGGWMQANGYTVAQMENDPALLEKGREYAINEAKKATYRDFNALASWLNNPQAAGHELKGTKFVLNAVLPFKKTPANILRRGIEYSPVGIAKSLYHLGRKFVRGDVSANQVIDELSSGLSGTAVMALGFLLAGTGAVSCGLGDDDDWLEELKGAQKYSVNLGKAGNEILGAFGVPKLFGEDVTYTMDWAAPMSMPFFVGAALREQADQNGWDVNKVLDAIGSISEPVFNLSMLDGVNSLLKVNSYSNENPVTQIGGKIVSNYVSSYIPSIVGAIARSIDDTQRKSFVTKGQNTGLEGTFRYAWESGENKIPGVSQSNIPVRDVWGNAKTTELAERLVENWISPGYIENYETDPVINEIGRLFDNTGSDALKPEHADKFIKDGGATYNLGPDEYDLYDKVHGQTQYDMLQQLVNDPDYQAITDDEIKVDIIDGIYKYATKVAKNAVMPSISYDKQTVSSMVKDGKIASYKKNALIAFEVGDKQGYSDMLNLLDAEGVDLNKTVKDKIGDNYRDKWKEAYTNYFQTNDPNEKRKYKKEMDRIEDKLETSGFDFNIYGKNGWKQKVDDEYEKDNNSGSVQQPARYIASAGMSDINPGRKRNTEIENVVQEMYKYPEGQLYGYGNIDLNHRQIVRNEDGSISTELSFSFYDEESGQEVLIPTVIDGRIVSEEEAIRHYYQTGEYLGKFDTLEEADEYAQLLHERQDWYYHQ